MNAQTQQITATPQVPHVYTAISNVMAALGKTGILKERKNQQQGYQFRGIDDVYNELNHLLSEHKLVMSPRMLSREVTERTNKSGGALFYVTLKAEFCLTSAVDGSQHIISTFGEAMDSGDKATNKAMSAAYKYAALMLFCIPTEADNDTENTTHDVAPMPFVNGTPGASKAALRSDYEIFIKAIRAAPNKAALDEWQKDNLSEINRLPTDWLKELRIEYTDRLKEFKQIGAA